MARDGFSKTMVRMFQHVKTWFAKFVSFLVLPFSRYIEMRVAKITTTNI